MKLVTIDAGPAGRAGAIVGSDVLDISRAGGAVPIANWVPSQVKDILAAGEEGLRIVERIVKTVEDAKDGTRAQLREIGALTALKDTQLLAPIPEPGLIFSCGMNYGEHLKEMGSGLPPHPTGFFKTSRAVVGPGAPIVIPPQCPDMVDFEGEFSFVVGRPCHNIDARDAMDYIAGYTIVNDVSARDWVPEWRAQEGVLAKQVSWERNILGKQLPTFSPLGPAIVTKDEIKDPHNLKLQTRLNGTVMQDTNTDDLVFKVPELLAYFSKWHRFLPGDVFTTGSPSGVGFARKPPVFMKPGDTVAITVEHVGTLENPIVAAN